MALRDELAERVGEGERVLDVGVNGEGREIDDPGGGFVVVEGNVEDGAARLAQVAERNSGGNADDPVDGLIGTALKGAADGVLAGKKVLTKISLTMAAPGEVSSGRKSRPERGGSSSSRASLGKGSGTKRESDWEARR